MGRLHWESWLLRLGLVGTLALQLATRNKDGAIVAGEGLVVSLLPLLVQRLSHTHVPRALEFAFVLGMALQFISESTKLFEVFYYWDKVVHPTLVALTAMVAGWLLLGYRDAFGARLGTHLAATFGLLLGACVGAIWEFVEFASDWFGNAGLQKSNGDTATDLIANDVGALVATILGMWIYAHWLGPNQRREMGHIARWLATGPARLLDGHGRLVGSGLAAALVAVIVAGVRIDANPPALAAGLSPGGSQQWSLAGGQPDQPPANAEVLLGNWLVDPNAGICRVNLDHPRPGSEKMGLLELAPGTVYGADGQPFSVSTRYVEVRPPKVEGTQMDGGIAFGVRDADDFYLLEQSALHDILRLDRYIHGKRRDVREALYRTHGNDWHSLQVTVDGGRVQAGIDGQPAYEVDDLPDTSGGIGLWGRTSESTCFADARVEAGSH